MSTDRGLDKFKNSSHQQEENVSVKCSRSRAVLKVYPFRHEWTIRNFRFVYPEMRTSVKSSTFAAGPNDELKWCLVIREEHYVKHISALLNLVSSNREEVAVRYKFSILNAQREPIYVKESQGRFRQGNPAGIDHFIRQDVLFGRQADVLLPDGDLAIVCDGSVITDEQINI